MIVPLIALTVARGADAAAPGAPLERFEGTVVSQRTLRVDGRIVTESLVRAHGGEQLAVRHLGGTIDGVGAWVPGAARVGPGERAVLWSERGWLRAKAAPTGPDAGGRRRYVRATAPATGVPVRWCDTSCVEVTLDAAGSDDLPRLGHVAPIERAEDNWRDARSYLTIDVVEVVEGAVADDQDYVNTVTWRERDWPAGYPAGASALTTLHFVDDEASPDNGCIFDADVELNGLDFAFFAEDVGCGGDSTMDLQNTMTHELGHMIGLDHTCYDGAYPRRPEDDRGDPIPDCGSDAAGAPDIEDATMFATARPCETDKRSLHDDDRRGLRGLYPLAQDPGACRPGMPPGGGGRTPREPGGLGCAAAGRGDGGAAAAAWATALAAVRRRSRRRGR